MIVLVTGGRDYKDRACVYEVLSKLHAKHKFTYLMHGDARGADRLAGEWAQSEGVQPVAFPALWDWFGDAAGTKRNASMLGFVKPDLVVAFPGGRGTSNMMKIAFKAGCEIIDVEDY